MGHVVVEITFYFRRLINCCECCHTVDSTRLDINYIKCYNSAQKQKVEYKRFNSDPHQRQPLLINYVR